MCFLDGIAAIPPPVMCTSTRSNIHSLLVRSIKRNAKYFIAPPETRKLNICLRWLVALSDCIWRSRAHAVQIKNAPSESVALNCDMWERASGLLPPLCTWASVILREGISRTIVHVWAPFDKIWTWKKMNINFQSFYKKKKKNRTNIITSSFSTTTQIDTSSFYS